MSIILASRGILGQDTHELLNVLPLAVGYVVAMSIQQKHQTIKPGEASSEGCIGTASCDVDFSGIHSIKGFTSSLESQGIHSEGIVKVGRLVNEVSSAALAKNADVIILVEESSRTNRLKLLGSDGLGVMTKTGKPVILQPSGCAGKDTGSILVAMSGAHSSPDSRWSLHNTLELAGKEVVVLAVSSPYYPMFGRTAIGMRAYHSEALHEVWSEQVDHGALSADMLSSKLKEKGAKSWFVSRTGRFVNEILKTAQSTQASLACILVDTSIRRRWFGKSDLADLLEVLNIPVMLVPCERSIRS